MDYLPYGVPEHNIENGKTTVTIDEIQGSLKVFGKHNLLNMHAAWLACSRLGISADQFVSAMQSFTGAARRLELVAEGPQNIIYRDFAHAPSKVKATMEAVKQQFPARRLVAVLELHTYSSLNADFMPQYAGSLDAAHEACVFYSRHAMEIKRMPELPAEEVREGFGKSDLFVTTNRLDLEQWLQSRNYENANLLLMSSGTFEGLDVGMVANIVLNKK
jgi:UDP-N-acetylmuramate: L-alanyl-gamma-D-glutamyl-meso-diaminopimelate ligase